MPKPVLLVDSYDSFAYNIVHALEALGVAVNVVTVDDPRLTPSAVREHAAVVIGPGPGSPHGYSAFAEIVTACASARLSLLGICLGMQAIALSYGARVVRGKRPVHGEVATIVHDGSELFTGIASPMRAMRYHSLCVASESLPATIKVTALSEDGVVQAIQDRHLPIGGVQFHPESFLSECGELLLRNFLRTVRR